MRILFTVHTGVSHLRLVVPLAQAAERAGHAVAVASSPSMRGQVESYGLAYLRAGIDWDTDPECLLAVSPAIINDDQPVYEQALVEDCILGNPALTMAEELLTVAAQWHPDVIVREGEEFGGYLAAERLGIPHAVVAGGSTHLLRPEAIHQRVAGLHRRFGLPEPELGSCYRHLLASWLPADYLLDDLATATLHSYRQEAPIRDEERMPTWVAELPADKPLVYASIGTIAPSIPWKTDHVVESIIAALGELDCTAAVSIGVSRDPGDFPTVPGNVRLVTDWVPQWLLLQTCSVFITHGGHSSIREGLRAGVPMLITPMYDDQPHSAQRCADIGVGISIPGKEVTTAGIRDGVRELLTAPNFRARSTAVQRQILAAPPISAMVDDLESLYSPAIAER